MLNNQSLQYLIRVHYNALKFNILHKIYQIVTMEPLYGIPAYIIVQQRLYTMIVKIGPEELKRASFCARYFGTRLWIACTKWITAELSVI